MAVHAVRSPLSFNHSYFLPSPLFPRVTMGTSLHSLEHTSPSCSDICKAFGSVPPRGPGRRVFPYVGLPALFIHVCICVCAELFGFVCFLLGFKPFLFSRLQGPPYRHDLGCTWSLLERGPWSSPLLPLGMDHLEEAFPSPVKEWEESTFCSFWSAWGDYAKVEEWCYKGISKTWRLTCCNAHTLYNSLLRL